MFTISKKKKNNNKSVMNKSGPEIEDYMAGFRTALSGVIVVKCRIFYRIIHVLVSVTKFYALSQSLSSRRCNIHHFIFVFLSRRNLDFQDVLDNLSRKGISIRVASPKLVMEEVRFSFLLLLLLLYKQPHNN